jgi:hypothetical protein
MLDSGPGQKSLLVAFRYVCAAILRLPASSKPPSHTAPAKSDETPGTPSAGSTAGTMYWPSERSHHTSPPLSRRARTLLIARSYDMVAGAQSDR